MPLSKGPQGAPHVVIAGGGFAGVETLLALRALAAGRVRVSLVSPELELAYRPAATLEAFHQLGPQFYDLRAICADLGATFHKARIEAVGSEHRYVRLSSGSRLSYDALVVALGARAVAAISGALMFRDQRDLPLFGHLLSDVAAGSVRRLVFALPVGCSWPVPIYELALLSAQHAAEHGVQTEVTIVSPEPGPLGLFGSEPSRLVGELLAECDIRFIGGAAARAVLRDGSLELRSRAVIKADRVVAGPQLRGQWLSGLPASRWGFVPTDSTGQVQCLPDVYAAGDVTTYPIKQAGIATQQADLIAHWIASAAGAELPEPRFRPILQARLVGGPQPLVLRAELDHNGKATSATLVRIVSDETAAHNKVFARYLSPYLAIHDSGELAVPA
jgi:sulfide:quinone oxidoreductase